MVTLLDRLLIGFVVVVDVATTVFEGEMLRGLSFSIVPLLVLILLLSLSSGRMIASEFFPASFSIGNRDVEAGVVSIIAVVLGVVVVGVGVTVGVVVVGII